jgi:hypothetical protein
MITKNFSLYSNAPQMNTLFSINQRTRALTIAIIAILLMQSYAGAATLDVGSQKGEKGDTVTFNINLDNAAEELDSLGFDVQYDFALLKYDSYQRGSLTENFRQLSALNIALGEVRIGGFDTGENVIASGAGGDIARITFEVVGQGGDCNIKITNLKDGLKSYAAQGGQFTYGPQTDDDDAVAESDDGEAAATAEPDDDDTAAGPTSEAAGTVENQPATVKTDNTITPKPDDSPENNDTVATDTSMVNDVAPLPDNSTEVKADNTITPKPGDSLENNDTVATGTSMVNDVAPLPDNSTDKFPEIANIPDDSTDQKYDIPEDNNESYPSARVTGNTGRSRQYTPPIAAKADRNTKPAVSKNNKKAALSKRPESVKTERHKPARPQKTVLKPQIPQSVEQIRSLIDENTRLIKLSHELIKENLKLVKQNNVLILKNSLTLEHIEKSPPESGNIILIVVGILILLVLILILIALLLLLLHLGFFSSRKSLNVRIEGR